MLLNKNIPVAYILKKIRLELVIVFIIGVVVYFLTHLAERVIPPMPIQIPAFLGTAISVILSFKLNQSYDRWWEARKIWGSIVNDSRNLVLQLQSFLSGSNDDIRKITLRQIAWCFSLGQSLRGQDPMARLEGHLTADELVPITEHNNKPLAILQLNAQHIADLRRDGKLDIFSHVQINSTMIGLTNSMGMAERIKSTVFPVTYRLFLRLFIYLFVITLSISLSDVAIYYEIPLLLVISSVFFLLERTATHLQDPFENRPTDTAMTAIATTIETNLKQLINDKNIPKSKPVEQYYLI
ncbi:MAG TPA: bestrophin family ion channel [Chryseosolibacter sp.]|nr:bestrophin family ion channel [Chryseosolibacter sp.]